MEFRGASVYDQEDFFANYMKRRGRQDSPNNAIGGLIINELIGDIHKVKHSSLMKSAFLLDIFHPGKSVKIENID